MDRILEAMRDGDWHAIGEVAEETRISESRVELISSFLATYDFVEFDRKDKRMRLSPNLKSFLKKIHEIEKDESFGKNRASLTNVLSSFRL